MIVKIVSDGTPMRTKVVNKETGEEIENITCINWNIDTGTLGTALIYIQFVPVEIETEAEIVTG